jgi:hypothetical protein
LADLADVVTDSGADACTDSQGDSVGHLFADQLQIKSQIWLHI